MSKQIRIQLHEAAVARVNNQFPLSSTMRDKQTGEIYVRGIEARGHKFWIMSLHGTKQCIAATLLELRFEEAEAA